MRKILRAFLPLLGGCFLLNVTAPVLGTSASSDWYEISPVARPAPEVMEIARETVRRSGFALLPPDGTDRIFTEWRVELSAHWRQGFRAKLELELVKLEGTPGLKLRVRGFRDVNDNSRNPSNAADAEWIEATFDEKQKDRIGEFAMKVHQILKFKLMEN